MEVGHAFLLLYTEQTNLKDFALITGYLHMVRGKVLPKCNGI